MTDRTRHFERALENLKNKIQHYLQDTLFVIDKTMNALKTGEENVIREVEDFDDVMDETHRQIENACFDIITRFHPLAEDLRLVVTAMKLSSDLERIGDMCVNIAQSARHISRKLTGFVLEDIFEKMVNTTIGMLQGIVEAYFKMDTEQALEIWKRDDVVDDLYLLGREKLLEMAAKETNITRARILLEETFILRYFERIADHVTNIAEEIYYMKTGKDVKKLLRPSDS